jgi:hypothetical protein
MTEPHSHRTEILENAIPELDQDTVLTWVTETYLRLANKVAEAESKHKHESFVEGENEVFDALVLSCMTRPDKINEADIEILASIIRRADKLKTAEIETRDDEDRRTDGFVESFCAAMDALAERCQQEAVGRGYSLTEIRASDFTQENAGPAEATESSASVH